MIPYMYSEMQNKLSKTRESPLESMGQIISSRCPTDSRPTTDELRGGHQIGAKGSLTSEAMRKLSFTPCTSKFLLTVRLVPFQGNWD